MLDVPYLLTVSTSHRFVWYRVPKVGTRSIYTMLEGTGAEDTNRRVRLLYLIGRYSRFYKFAFVRNPWDRLVSAWANKVRDNDYSQFHFDADTRAEMQDFGSFVRWVCSLELETADRHIKPQVALIDVDEVDFVGRMDSFDQDAAAVCERLGLEPPARRIGATDRDGYRSYYDETTRALVGDAYAADVEQFHFDF